MSPMPEPTVLLDALAHVESPQWHAGRLHFAHRGTSEVARRLEVPKCPREPMISGGGDPIRQRA